MLENALHIKRKAKPKHTHPFTQEIMDVSLPERYKMALYKRKTDPDEHFRIYIGHINL